jgi:hypothetical protein
MEEIMKNNQQPKTKAITKAKATKSKAIATAPQEKTKAAESANAAKEKPIRQGSKQSIIISMLKASKGATVAELSEATGWQKHSVQGAMSGALKKKLGLTITSEKEEKRGRVYRIA